MGSNTSRKKNTGASTSVGNNNLYISKELNSYVEACRLDVDLRTFAGSLRDRTNTVIPALAAGVEVRTVSLDSLKMVTECLLEMNQEVVKVNLDCKKDIWNNGELLSLVEDYFDNSLHTLDFCSVLEKSLKRARDSQILILVAIDEKKGYEKMLENLKRFAETGDPFTEEFFHLFQSVYLQQISLLEKLRKKKMKLDKKLKSINRCRKISSIIFAATFTAVVICSVVAAALAAPPVAAAVSAAAAIPLGSIGKWIDSLMEKREDGVKGQKEIVNSLKVGMYISVKDLDGIRVLVDKLEMELESMIKNADLGVKENAMKIRLEEMRKKITGFMKNLDDLKAQAENCSRDIRRARKVVLRRIIKL